MESREARDNRPSIIRHTPAKLSQLITFAFLLFAFLVTTILCPRQNAFYPQCPQDYYSPDLRGCRYLARTELPTTNLVVNRSPPTSLKTLMAPMDRNPKTTAPSDRWKSSSAQPVLSPKHNKTEHKHKTTPAAELPNEGATCTTHDSSRKSVDRHDCLICKTINPKSRRQEHEHNATPSTATIADTTSIQTRETQHQHSRHQDVSKHLHHHELQTPGPADARGRRQGAGSTPNIHQSAPKEPQLLPQGKGQLTPRCGRATAKITSSNTRNNTSSSRMSGANRVTSTNDGEANHQPKPR